MIVIIAAWQRIKKTRKGTTEIIEGLQGVPISICMLSAIMSVIVKIRDNTLLQLNRLKLAEKEKDALEGEREAADQFLRLDASIRRKQNVLYQSHMASAAANVENVSNDFVSPLTPRSNRRLGKRARLLCRIVWLRGVRSSGRRHECPF